MPDAAPPADLLGRLAVAPPLLLDGGLGTALIARGLPAHTAPETWMLERPEAVAAVHRAFVASGSEALHTNTFGGNPVRLGAAGLAPHAREIHAAAVRAARSAGARFVLADIGPTGVSSNAPSRREVSAFASQFASQASLVADLDIDGVHIETMPSLAEASAALAAVRGAHPRLPVFVSLVFVRTPNGYRTPDGEMPAVALRRLLEAGASGVGANCNLTSAEMLELLEGELAAIEGPLLLQPCAGPPNRTAGGIAYDLDPEGFAADMERAARILAGRGHGGAIGGCCGIDPRHLAALRRRIGPQPPDGA